MFIKLHFTANTRFTVPFRILADIINTNTVTSVSTLQSRHTSASSTLLTNLDAANSLIIRTVDPSNTRAVFHATNISNAAMNMVIEQPAYDSATQKIYSQIFAAASDNPFFDIGTSITGGTIASSTMGINIAETNSASQGTSLTLGGNYGKIVGSLSNSNGRDNIRTFWAYVTNRCFIWAVTNSTSFNVGFFGANSDYANSANYGGPFIQTQYTRFDYHNTDANNVFPVLFSNQRGAGIGFGTSADITTVQNLNFATNSTTIPFRVNSCISALPQVGTAWPRILNQQVHLTIAGRSAGYFPANSGLVVGTVSTATAASYAGSITTAASTRYPNTTLTGTGFAMLPFGWEATTIGNHGGNATDQCGVYIFNGDYVPGDTFVYNNKIYMIWPLYGGFSNRVGLAVPME